MMFFFSKLTIIIKKFIIIKKRFTDPANSPRRLPPQTQPAFTLEVFTYLSFSWAFFRCLLAQWTRKTKAFLNKHTASCSCKIYIYSNHILPLKYIILQYYSRCIIYEIRNIFLGTSFKKSRREGTGGRRPSCCRCVPGESFDASDDVTADCPYLCHLCCIAPFVNMRLEALPSSPVLRSKRAPASWI